MTCFRTFASGSSGNAALLSCGNTHLLIDMGISCRRICRALAEQGLTPEDLSAILITHEHTDHISGLATYIKNTARLSSVPPALPGSFNTAWQASPCCSGPCLWGNGYPGRR